MNNKNQHDILYDLIQEVREDQREANKTLSDIQVTMQRNTTSLEKHIEGVNTLKSLHFQNEQRIAKLEEPNKVIVFLRKKILFYATFIAGAAGAVAAVMEAVSYFKSH